MISEPALMSLSSSLWLTKSSVASPEKEPSVAVLMDRVRFAVSCAPRSPIPPVTLKPAGSLTLSKRKTSLRAVTAAVLVTSTFAVLEAPPMRMKPRSTLLVPTPAAAAVYTLPCRFVATSATSALGTMPDVPTPLDSRPTVAVPVKDPAVLVSRLMLKLLSESPAAINPPNMPPLLNAASPPKVTPLPCRLSEKPSAAAMLLIVRFCEGPASPTRAARTTGSGAIAPSPTR